MLGSVADLNPGPALARSEDGSLFGERTLCVFSKLHCDYGFDSTSLRGKPNNLGDCNACTVDCGWNQRFFFPCQNLLTLTVSPVSS